MNFTSGVDQVHPIVSYLIASYPVKFMVCAILLFVCVWVCVCVCVWRWSIRACLLPPPSWCVWFLSVCFFSGRCVFSGKCVFSVECVLSRERRGQQCLNMCCEFASSLREEQASTRW